MERILHWGCYAICVAISLPILHAYGIWAYLGSIVALSVVMVGQWVEGRISLSRESGTDWRCK